MLSFQQEKLYFDSATGDLRDIGMLELDTGLRQGEALSLEWLDVRLEPAPGAKFGYLTVRASKSKNAKKRNVPLTLRAVEMLRATRSAKGPYVFHRADGSQLYQTWLNNQHAELRDTLRLPKEFVPHSFRHTYGTRLGEAGANAFTIMELMGHSSVVVSQRYVHPSPALKEAAVENMEALNPNRASAEVPTNHPTMRKPRRVK